MRLARIRTASGVRPALLDEAGTPRDLSSHLRDVGGDALLPAGLHSLARLDPGSLPALPAGGGYAPPLSGIGKIIGVGLNYRAHAAECNLPLPEEPTLFLKPTSALAGPDDPVIMPPDATALDWEAELGIVIGQPGAYIQAGRAMDHVAGYVLGIDFSERVFQFKRGGQGFKGKSSDSFAPLGPWFVSASAVPDPAALRLRLSVNGTLRQDGDTADMIFPVPELIAAISRFMSLQPGDVILSGTPAGVGMGQTPPTYLAPDDVVTADGGVLGTHRHVVTPYARPASPAGR